VPRYNSNVSITNKTIAGMSLGGGRKENFFFCLLEYFPSEDRWFLSQLKQVEDEKPMDRDELIMKWISNHQLTKLIVDFPLSRPTCDVCELECPGTEACHHPVVTQIRNEIDTLLGADQKLIYENPKKYEQERVESNLVQYSKDLYAKETTTPLLSRPFKRKLRKGYLPYWNRPVDFWIWKNFYDQALELFNISYDSFGNVSIMLLNRFKYLRKHFPDELSIFESNTYVVLMELYRADIVTMKMLRELQDIQMSPVAKLDIIRAIENKLKIFIYEHDLESIVKSPKAFDSFLLAVAGRSLVMNNNRKIPTIGNETIENFVIPNFS